MATDCFNLWISRTHIVGERMTFFTCLLKYLMFSKEFVEKFKWKVILMLQFVDTIILLFDHWIGEFS